MAKHIVIVTLFAMTLSLMGVASTGGGAKEGIEQTHRSITKEFLIIAPGTPVWFKLSQAEKIGVLESLVVKKLEELDCLAFDAVKGVSDIKSEFVSSRRKDQWKQNFTEAHQRWKTQVNLDAEVVRNIPLTGAGSGQEIEALSWQIEQIESRIKFIKRFWWAN